MSHIRMQRTSQSSPDMAALVFLLAEVAGIFTAVLGTGVPTPVSTTVFYETLCPDCQKFLPGKLVSTYTDSRFDFASLFANLTLVPYGWATAIDPQKHIYKCQHGDSECDGNRLHGCAIKYVTKTMALLNYISCLESSSDEIKNSVEYPVDKCKDKITDSAYNNIMTCYNSDEGWDIFAENGRITTSFLGGANASVPYIAFNNERDDRLSDEATSNFRKILCWKTGVVNDACSDYPKMMH